MLGSDYSMLSHPPTQKKKFYFKVVQSAAPLTKIELAVLNAMAYDYTREEISVKLRLPMGVLRVCIRSVINKLGVDNRLEAVCEALERSIIELPEDKSSVWRVL